MPPPPPSPGSPGSGTCCSPRGSCCCSSSCARGSPGQRPASSPPSAADRFHARGFFPRGRFDRVDVVLSGESRDGFIELLPERPHGGVGVPCRERVQQG